MQTVISLAQMTIAFGLIQQNVEQAAAWVAEAARQGSSLLLLPELWSSGYDLVNSHQHARDNRRILPVLHQLARENHIHIGGSLLLEDEIQNVYNTFILIDPEGREIATYRKIHLFRLMDEEKWLQAGSIACQLNTSFGQTGLSICYDLRFPELFRQYALNGAQLVLLSAEWPVRRIEHWRILLRARAIENQMFIAAVNTVGSIGDAQYGGSSAIVSPWGEVLVEGSRTDPGLLTAEIDLDLVDKVRSHIPVFADRRPDVYESPSGE